MKLYIDRHGAILHEELREDAVRELLGIEKKINYLVNGSSVDFWRLLHQEIVNLSNQQEKQDYLDIEAQILSLPTFIETWMKTALDSKERWELFVMVKAQEIRSNDLDRDYFWALAIRHDQIVALVRVLKKLTDWMTDWVTKKPREVLEDGVFWGLADYPVERQVYLEAEKVHQEREALVDKR